MEPGTALLQPASTDADKKEKLMIEVIFNHPWVWIIAIVLLILLVATILCFKQWQPDYEDFIDNGWNLIGLLCGVVFLGLGGAYFGAMLPPYDLSFHATYRITGEVSDLEKGFTGDGDGVFSSGFVLEVEGVDDYLIWSDDQRFRTIEVGDDVNLVCSKEFRYFQEPYYDCNFGS